MSRKRVAPYHPLLSCGRPLIIEAAGMKAAGISRSCSLLYAGFMTNRERATKAIHTAYAYQWFEGYAPQLSDLEQSECGRAEIVTSVADLLTDLQHWAKFNGVDFEELVARSEWMFREEDRANCVACNENNEEIEHTCY